MVDMVITESCSNESILSLWAEIFGEDEAEMERVQISGTESEYNTDIVFSAVEGEKLLGTVHITVPLKCREIAGISAVCTIPEARGRGVAKKLFNEAMKKMREMGVSLAFLGTGNTIAVNLYSSFGFSFMPGSHVMACSFDGTVEDKFDELFTAANKNIKICRGTPGFRIPVIPLINSDEKLTMADVNTSIPGRGYFSQNSCMGLYPKYDNLRENGGDYFGAVGENGILVALISVLPLKEGVRADFLFNGNSQEAASQLIKFCEEKYGNIFFQVSDADENKVELLGKNGYIKREEMPYNYGNKSVPAVYRWTK